MAAIEPRRMTAEIEVRSVNRRANGSAERRASGAGLLLHERVQPLKKEQ
jgi:hypothetical protein